MSANDESHWKQDIEPRTDYNSEEEDSNDAESFGYEQKSGNYPLFFLTNNFPAGYHDEMCNGSGLTRTSWIAISSDSPTTLFRDIKANIAAAATGKKLPTPFLTSTVEEVYEFFKNHVRPADDDPQGKHRSFTYFTFLVIDDECVESEPWQIMLCSDAPDYGEGHSETRLKQYRLPIAKAINGLNLIEDLIQTPTEMINRPEFMLSMTPPGWLVINYDDQGEMSGYVVATPGRARAKKNRIIWELEQEDKEQKADLASVARREL